jgi:hypothetical protein
MLARVALSPNHQGHHAAQPFSRHFQDRARRVVTVCTGVVEDASSKQPSSGNRVLKHVSPLMLTE